MEHGRGTVAQRLAKAIEWSELPTKAVAGRLQREKIQGASYPSIQRCLNGEQQPSLSLLVGVARVCGVRPAWLAFGDGEPTTVRELARQRVAHESGGLLRFAGAHLVNESLNAALPDYHRLDPSIKAAFWEVLTAWHHLTEPSYDPDGSGPYADLPDRFPGRPKRHAAEVINMRMAQLARRLGGFVAEPLNEMGTSDLSGRQFESYVRLMLMAFRELMPDRALGVTLRPTIEVRPVPLYESEAPAPDSDDSDS